MTAATVSRLGAVNKDTGTYAKDNDLFLKVFSGETMAEFATQNVTMERTMVRTIDHGKSASFPRMGKTVAAYHTPGAEITGGAIGHNEVVITIDDLLLTSTFIANIDEAKNHYDVRSHYSREMGSALANQMDRHIFSKLITAAQTADPVITGGDTGDTIENAVIASGSTAAEKADALVDSVLAALQKLDENNVPASDRFIALAPQEFYLLINASKVLNRDYGGMGSIASGTAPMIGGVPVVMSNQIPTTNISSTVEAGDAEARHAVDARNTKALVWHKSAVGTVKLLDLATESEYDIRRQGTLMVAKYAVGHGVLRPEAAIQIRTATPST